MKILDDIFRHFGVKTRFYREKFDIFLCKFINEILNAHFQHFGYKLDFIKKNF